LKIETLKIGNITLSSNIILAPMAGITDLPFRVMAKAGGAGLVCTEMVSAKALAYADKKTRELMTIDAGERPVSIQIFGADIDSMTIAAKIVEQSGADILDINLGCPVRKIAKSGAGAKLTSNEKLTAQILEAVVKAVKIPVTLKTRLGPDPEQNTAPRIIKIAYECGIKMAALHARYTINGHSGAPDINTFKEACCDSKIPIIANGGIDFSNAGDFLSADNCVGLMIGRGAIGNYSIFSRLQKFLDTGVINQEPPLEQKMSWLVEHARKANAYYANGRGLIIMRKTLPYYFKGLPNCHKIIGELNQVSTIEEFERAVGEYLG
jgi:tRNA-dihydrouridine synthase B